MSETEEAPRVEFKYIKLSHCSPGKFLRTCVHENWYSNNFVARMKMVEMYRKPKGTNHLLALRLSAYSW